MSATSSLTVKMLTLKMNKNNFFLEAKMKSLIIIKDIFGLIDIFMGKIYCNIVFNSGIRIYCNSKDESVCFELIIKIDGFDYFNCDKKIFSARFDLVDFCDKIRQIDRDHTYCLFIKRKSLDKLYIRNLDENQQDIVIKLKNNCKPNLMPRTMFDYKIVYDLSYFKKMFRDIDDVESNFVNIDTVKKRFSVFSVLDKNISGNTYPVKFFKRLSELSNNYKAIQLYIKSDSFLSIQILPATSDNIYIVIKPVDPVTYFNCRQQPKSC